MMNIKKHPTIWGALISITIMLSGCSTLRPLQKQEEVALPPAESPLWSTIAKIQENDWIHILNAGHEAIEWRLRVIDSATQSIDLQTFLWEDDEIGLAVMKHLVEAADRGVRVRLLLDDTFTTTHAEEIKSIDQHPNIDFRIYNPFKRRNDHMVMRQLMNLGEFGRLDHRMHNKSLIVDNRAAIIGGRNLANEYFGTHEVRNFRDMELLCAGAGVQALSSLFDEFWNNNWTFPESLILEKSSDFASTESYNSWIKPSEIYWLNETGEQRKQAWVSLVHETQPANWKLFADEPAPVSPNAKDELPNQFAEELIHIIDESRSSVTLVSAYLIPTPELEMAVERAENRGVDVKILTNSLQSNNHLAAHSAYRRHIHQLVKHGADLHEVRVNAKDRHVYMNRPVETKELGLHAKLILFDDDRTFIGSANLDPRSLRLNTEMGLLIQSRDINQQVRRLLEVDFDKRNAWHLEPQPDGSIQWVSDEERLTKQPAASAFQRLEDWFLSILPVEGEL